MEVDLRVVEAGLQNVFRIGNGGHMGFRWGEGAGVLRLVADPALVSECFMRKGRHVFQNSLGGSASSDNVFDVSPGSVLLPALRRPSKRMAWTRPLLENGS